MKSEGQIVTEKFSAGTRDNTDIADSSDLKGSLCCPLTSCLSTGVSACRRGSATSEINASDKFDDIDNIVGNYNENAAPSKRKLPRKSKGLNVKSKLRKTFSMCCAHGQDVSLDETDADEFDSIERESRADDAPFQQGNTGNEKLQSTKDETHKSKNNSAKWAVSKPIVRQKLFNRDTSRPSTRYGSAHQAKNRSKSKYKSSTNQPSSVTIAAADGSSSLDNVSGTSEVKRSKAEHALDLTEKQDSEETSDTTSIQGRIIKTARRRTRGSARQENESTPFRFEPETVSSDEKKEERPTLNQLPPLQSIDSAVVPSADETTPVYIETEATIDYGRCVVEPGHGERPDKKKLRAEIKEKVKTKGEANKHLRPGRENHANDYDTMMEEYLAVVIDETKGGEDFENEPEEQEEYERAVSPVILNAVDQPQVLDDREFHLVPEEIKRADDPYLEDVEEDYKVSTTPHSSKKEKRKLKNDRKKEKRSRKGGQTVLKLS